MTRLDIHAREIDIEIDDLAPSVAGDFYYAISPFGSRPGPHSSQQVSHDVIGVRVCVFQRITDVPRDRRREAMIGSSLFKGRLSSLNQRLTEISQAVRNNHCLVGAATEALAGKGFEAQFVKPLVPVSYDAKPTMVTGETYAAKKTNSGGEMWVAMKRGINFGNAEVIG